MWALSCTFRLLSGCFAPAPLSGEAGSEAIEVLAVQILDHGGGSWTPDAIPRMPRITVELSTVAAKALKNVWLVSGTTDDDLLADLLDPPLRSASEARLVAVAIDATGRRLTLVPDGPLPPRTQLTLVVRTAVDQVYTRALHVSSSPAAGAALVATFPAQAAHAVPTNLQAILLRFDGALGPLPQSPVTLRRQDESVSASVERLRCDDLGLGPGDCVRLIPPGALARRATYSVDGQKLLDATGAPLLPLHFEFTTGAEPDHQVPMLGDIACAPDERAIASIGCLLASDAGAILRVAPNEPIRAELRISNASASALSNHDSCVLALNGLNAEQTYAAALTLTDVAGNSGERALEIHTPARLAQVVFDEVRGDPLGPEPAQELVELLNSGTDPVSLMGFSISTNVREQGRAITTALEISPGERVLVVAPSFDIDDASDGELPAGVRIARLDGTLSLANAGQALVLRDNDGGRLDTTPVLSAPPGQCIARTKPPLTRFDGSGFVVAPCTPGEASEWP